MKKLFKIVIPVIFLCVLGYFGYQIITKLQYKTQVAENIKMIPNFVYQNVKGGVFSDNDLKLETPTLFVYFNTGCEFCNEETEMIKSNIEKFKNAQLVFVSFEDKQIINQFAINHQLNTYDNITFLSDTKVSFATTFDIKSLPSMILYDKNKRLIDKIKGQTKTEVLIQKLNL